MNLHPVFRIERKLLSISYSYILLANYMDDYKVNGNRGYRSKLREKQAHKSVMSVLGIGGGLTKPSNPTC
jgi:hypothetical protein